MLKSIYNDENECINDTLSKGSCFLSWHESGPKPSCFIFQRLHFSKEYRVQSIASWFRVQCKKKKTH